MLRRLFVTVYSGGLKQKEPRGEGRWLVLGVHRAENTDLPTGHGIIEDSSVWEEAESTGGN